MEAALLGRVLSAGALASVWFAVAAIPCSAIPPSDEKISNVTLPVAVVGVLGIGDQWQVVLKDYASGQTRVLREGEAAFGYRVKRIMARGVVLEARGEDFELRIGEHRVTALPEWVQQWRRNLGDLSPEQQQKAREEMREYWRQLWETGLANLVSKLTPEEQVSTRRLISSLWRE